jgi:NAD kinase
MLHRETGVDISKLVLNEVFAAEKDVSTTSMYRLEVDGRDMGKFKSSGVIIATGTGSSGWLFSARQVTYHDIELVQKIIGTDEQSEFVIIK